MSNNTESENEASLPLSPERQRATLGHLLIRETFFLQCKDRIQPSWFVDPIVQTVYSTLIAYYKQYHKFPTSEDVFEHPNIQAESQQRRNLIRTQISVCLNAAGVYQIEPIQAELTNWLHARTFVEGIYKAKDLFNRKQFTEAYSLLEKTNRTIRESSFNQEKEYRFGDIEAIFAKRQTNVEGALTWGLSSFDKLLLPEGNGQGCLLPGTSTVIVGSSNAGKCHGKGTEIIDFSGRIVKVEDVKPGDLLMGPDGKPRTVLGTTKGYGNLFRVSPKAGGNPFVCNDVHVLSLKKVRPENRVRHHKCKDGTITKHINSNPSRGKIVNIPLNEYLEKSDTFKKAYRLWRAKLDFSHKELSIPPYILGAWLGDGHSRGAVLTTMDLELENAWSTWSLSIGDRMRVWTKEENRASIYASSSQETGRAGEGFKALKALGLVKNKHIPQDYLTSSRDQRLELLAGLLDTDGHYSFFEDETTSSPSFDFIQKNEELANQVAFLARSLGFKVSVSECQKHDQNGTVGTYFRLTILGKLSQIPTKLPRKRAVDGKKDPSVSGFRIESIGEGDYYGFELDGDHLYLLSDFTVTHNTTCLLTVSSANLRRGKKVLAIFHEGSPEELQVKWLCAVAGKNMAWWKDWCYVLSKPDLSETEVQVFDFIKKNQRIIDENLTFLPMIRQGLAVEEVMSVIRRKQEEMLSATGKGYDLLVDDYPALLTSEEARGGKMEVRHRDSMVYSSFTRIGEELGFHVLTSAQTNREGARVNSGEKGKERRLLTMTDIAESFGVMQNTATVITINRDGKAEQKGRVVFHCAKSRTGDKGWSIVAKSAYGMGRSHWENFGACWYRGEATPTDKMDALLENYRNQEIPYDEEF